MLSAILCCPSSEVEVEADDFHSVPERPLTANFVQDVLGDDPSRLPHERFHGEFPEAAVRAATAPEPYLALAPAPEPGPKPEPRPEPKPDLTPPPEKEFKKKFQLKLPFPLREEESDYDYDDFQISFTKIAGESLGAVAWKGRRSFCLMMVVRGGPIERWNKRNELTVLKSGAIVYEVSDERGDSALSGEAMISLAKAARHVTIKARYYKKKKVCVEKPKGYIFGIRLFDYKKKKVYIEKAKGCILGIRLFEGTTTVESIEKKGLVATQNDLVDERNLILPGDRITHINSEECDGGNIVQMLRDVTGNITLTVRNAGCVLDL